LPAAPDTQLHLIHPTHQCNAPCPPAASSDCRQRAPLACHHLAPSAAATGRELRPPRSTSSSSASNAARKLHRPLCRRSPMPRLRLPPHRVATAAAPVPRAATPTPPLPASLPRIVRRVACRRCPCAWERGGGLRERVLEGERRLEKDGRGRLRWGCQRWWRRRLLGPRELCCGLVGSCGFVILSVGCSQQFSSSPLMFCSWIA